MVELARLNDAEALEAPRQQLTLVLENVRSGHNVGSIFRTADCFWLQELVLVGITPQPPHREILKSSLGAEATVPWRHFSSIAEAVAALRQTGHEIWALEQAEPSVRLAEMTFVGRLPLALVLGNEVRGVSPEALALVDGAVEIEQYGAKHSFNVSVSAALAAYAFVREVGTR